MNALALSILISYESLLSGGSGALDAHVEKPRFETLLTRHEWHQLGDAAWQISMLIQNAQPVATQVWPHAARDSAGRAGLIIKAERPLMMTLNVEDIRLRAAWTLAAVLAAGRFVELEGLPVDHLALTDADGAHHQKWYYDVDVQTARHVFVGLRDRKISMDQAYSMITSSWKLVTPPETAMADPGMPGGLQ